jgi:flavin-dependent dehydrogenase
VIDLLVAGGGPAGLATALYAHRAGLDVAVVEPRRAPIDKACGEGLMPGAVRALTDLGVVVEGQPLAGIRYLAGDRSVQAPFRAGPGLGVPRARLHEALDAARAQAGIILHQERLEDVRQGVGAVTAGGIRARYLAAADGLHSSIRADLGLGRQDRARHRWGIRAHFAVAPWTDHVEVHWSADSEAYVTPVGPHCVGVAILTSRRAAFAQHLDCFPALAERLPDTPSGRVRAAGPLRQRVSGVVAGRVLLVGDAAGYVDALTGEGLAVAFYTARELVAAVVRDDPQRYGPAARRVSRRYRLMTQSLLWAAGRPALRARIVPAASALPRLFGSAVNLLAG